MPTWLRTLRQTGITEPDLTAAYGQQRALVRRFKIEEYVAVRLLLPTRLHSAVIAATAFMHETDQRIDTGTIDTRRKALEEWGTAARKTLDGAPATDATLIALRDAAMRHPQLKDRVEAFLRGAPHEVDYAGFRTEDELQAYVDGYALPAFMLLACLLEQENSAEAAAFESRCRDLIEAMQRVDFLEDLAEDAAQGHVGLPAEELERHGLSVEGLRAPTGAARAGLEQLVREQAELAQARLTASRALVNLVPGHTRPFVAAMVQVQELRLRAVRRKGGSLVDGGTRPALPALLRVLTRHYRAARRMR